MMAVYLTGGCSSTRERKVYLIRLLLMACVSTMKVAYGAHGQLHLLRLMMTVCKICAVGMALESLDLLRMAGSTPKYSFRPSSGSLPVASEVSLFASFFPYRKDPFN